VRWVRAHADEYNLDPDRVCAVGDSSGGQLAALLAVLETRDDSDPELAGISSRVDCAVTIAGVVDLTVPFSDPEQVAWDVGIYGGTLADMPEAYVAASATQHVDPDTVPMLIVHGNRDLNVPIEQSRNLADALGEAGIEFAYAELPSRHGMDGILQYPPTWELVRAFLGYQLHPER
jgi:acetyl esterase/lipase